MTRPRPVDISKALNFSIDISMAQLEHARVVRDFGPVPLVDATETRLTQVFINLLVNAAHAIAPGRPEENEIRLSTRTDARGYAVIEVHDTGRGISADHLHRIFDPFFTTKEPSAAGWGCRSATASLNRSRGASGRERRLPAPASVFRSPCPSTLRGRIRLIQPARRSVQPTPSGGGASRIGSRNSSVNEGRTLTPTPREH